MFDYDNYEWDNVPKVIPRYFIHLEKFVKAIVSTMDEFNKREHVDELRADLENQIDDTSKEIQRKREVDLTEKNQINLFASNLSEEVDDHWANFGGFRDQINELRNEKCIENFDEQLIDYMKARPVGFEIEKFEP